MPGTKDDLRAEIASLREELAAERGKNEVLREQHAAHSCFGHATWLYPPAAAAPVGWWQQFVTSGSGTTGWNGLSDVTTSVAAGCAGAGISTYTLLS